MFNSKSLLAIMIAALPGLAAANSPTGCQQLDEAINVAFDGDAKAAAAELLAQHPGTVAVFNDHLIGVVDGKAVKSNKLCLPASYFLPLPPPLDE